ncbi:MAG: hypothetical protein ACK5X3_02590 [Pseudomonadota bacterium]
MTNEELDEARADEGRRIWDEMGRPDEVRPGWIVARLAREAAEARIAELEARVAELERRLTEAKTPSHFVDWSEEGGDFCTDIESVIESAIYDTPPGLHLFEVMTFRECPTVWAVVHCLTEDEREALGADTDWTLTECATEAEARALLKEDDRSLADEALWR